MTEKKGFWSSLFSSKKENTTQEPKQENKVATETQVKKQAEEQDLVQNETLDKINTEETAAKSNNNQEEVNNIEVAKEELTQEDAEIENAKIENAKIENAKIEANKEKVLAEKETKTEDKVEDKIEVVEKNQYKEQEQEEKEEALGFFGRLLKGLDKTKNALTSGLKTLFTGKAIDKALFEELEEKLLISDVGLDTTDKIIKDLTKHVSFTQLNDSQALYEKLQEDLYNILAQCQEPLVIEKNDTEGKMPFLILMVGVNGVGKTTTIGKLTKRLQAQGKSVVLAAGDTFRAAAVEQLQEWGKRNDVEVKHQSIGADSASVIYDTYASAIARKIDVVIADTAGRLQNKDNLIEELKKIVRVIKKLNPDAPHEIMLTLDAATGQNALSQIKIFNEAVGITGINLTKLDGTSKGGVIFAIADQYKIPIRFIGVGEKIDDLREFDAKDFISALFKE